jgi:hypothetical protein
MFGVLADRSVENHALGFHAFGGPQANTDSGKTVCATRILFRDP